MENENLFKWKDYQPEIILLTVRWYLRYNLGFHNLVEMLEERGLSIAHTTIMRSEGKTIDFYLCESRDKQAAMRFFKKVLTAPHVVNLVSSQ